MAHGGAHDGIYCDAHAGHEYFDVMADQRYHLFQKAVWSDKKRGEQVLSMRGKFAAAEAPAAANAYFDFLLLNSTWSRMAIPLQYIGFNWHAPKGSVQSCCLQVVCKKCGRATSNMFPFEWCNTHNVYKEDIMMDFVDILMKILFPLHGAPPPPPPRPLPGPQEPYRCHFADIAQQNALEWNVDERVQHADTPTIIYPISSGVLAHLQYNFSYGWYPMDITITFSG